MRPATLALWHVADPGNVGTLLRSADAFGAGVALSPGCADPTGPKALRASMGARVPRPGVRLRRARRARRDRARRHAAARRCRSSSSTATIVFVLGAEREGLPKDVLERCDVQASIPQSGDAESLNVAMAGTVALYERPARLGPRQRRAGPAGDS